MIFIEIFKWQKAIFLLSFRVSKVNQKGMWKYDMEKKNGLGSDRMAEGRR